MGKNLLCDGNEMWKIMLVDSCFVLWLIVVKYIEKSFMKILGCDC